jgi:Tol biopolymer transport system component
VEQPSESETCRQIIFSYAVWGRNGFERNVVSTCPDGTEKERLTVDGIGSGRPLWSPDGSQIAFLSGRSGGAQLRVMDADGGSERQITQGLDIVDYAWLPEGDKLSVRVWNESGQGDWRAFDVETGEQTFLTEWSASEGIQVLSHDVQLIAYVLRRQSGDEIVSSEIRVQHVDGTGDFALTDFPGKNFSPVWSRDDTQIAFLSNRAGDENAFAIHVVDADGSNLHPVTEPIFDEEAFFGWAPDGSAFVVFTDGAIYVLDRASGDMLKLFDVDYPNYVYGFSWQP